MELTVYTTPPLVYPPLQDTTQVTFVLKGKKKLPIYHPGYGVYSTPPEGLPLNQQTGRLLRVYSVAAVVVCGAHNPMPD